MQPGHDGISGFNLGNGELRGSCAGLQLEQELGLTSDAVHVQRCLERMAGKLIKGGKGNDWYA